jgi:prepilin-type N-terminal cleavage/methylation domain-containing protein
MKGQKLAGFTLLELLIVILIISILMGALIVGATSFIGHSKVLKTEALITRLDGGLRDYKTRTGGLPPIDDEHFSYDDNWENKDLEEDRSSMALHRGLGAPHHIPVKWKTDDKGNPIPILRKFPPILKIDEGMIEGCIGPCDKNHSKEEPDIVASLADPVHHPSRIIDAWGKHIIYRMPGVNHREKGTGRVDTSGWCDIWSAGIDGVFGDVYTPDDEDAKDNICNFRR